MQQIAQKFTKYEWLILLFILAPLLYPNGVQGYLLAVIPLLWMIRWLGERHFIPPTPLDVIILLLLMTVGVSMIAVFDPALSFPKIAGVLLGISLFYGAVDVMRRFSYGSWYIFTFFLLSGSGMAAVGLIGTRWSGPFAALNRIKNGRSYRPTNHSWHHRWLRQSQRACWCTRLGSPAAHHPAHWSLAHMATAHSHVCSTAHHHFQLTVGCHLFARWDHRLRAEPAACLCADT